MTRIRTRWRLMRWGLPGRCFCIAIGSASWPAASPPCIGASLSAGPSRRCRSIGPNTSRRSPGSARQALSAAGACARARPTGAGVPHRAHASSAPDLDSRCRSPPCLARDVRRRRRAERVDPRTRGAGDRGRVHRALLGRGDDHTTATGGGWSRSSAGAIVAPGASW